jgi:predicted outer membrane repeat protein
MYFNSQFEGLDVVIDRSRFIGNYGSNRGGALYFETLDATGTNIQIRDCSFEANRANDRGGAIYSVNTELVVLDCGFFGNDGDANNDDNPNDTDYPGDAFWINTNSRIPILVNNAFCGTRLEELVGPWIDKGGNIFEANCEFDCDGDGLPDDYEIEVGLAFDCNANGLPDSCEITSGADGDCNDDGRLDSCEVLADGAADCDGNLVPDSCQPDCDGDLLPDVCAIAAGAADCDGDLVPEACQIADGSVPDANNDQVLDTCQVLDFAGLSTEIVLIQDRILDTQIPSTAVCYRLYADLLDPMASVTGVFGDLEHPLDLSSPAGFWQDLLGSDIPTSIACDPMPDYPDLRYDSWLTIGNDCQDDNLVQSIGIDYTSFNQGGSLIADDGIVFVAPGDPQSAPVDGRVLVAQLTTVDGSLPEGEVSLIGSNADGTEWFAYSVTWPEAPLVDCNGNGVHDAYDLSSGASRDCDGSGQPDECEFDSIIDCNGNGISDLCDVADGTSGDADGDLVPDECECFGDANRDGVVNVYDIIAVIIHWGEIGIQDADVNGDEIVDGGDLAAVLTGYGTCL